MKRIFLLFANLLICLMMGAQVVRPLIPYPLELSEQNLSPFKLSPMTGIKNESSVDNNVFLRDYLEQDFLLVLQNRKGTNQIILKEDNLAYHSHKYYLLRPAPMGLSK